MHTERSQYTFLGTLKAMLAKKLIRLASRLTSDVRVHENVVLVSLTEADDVFGFAIFGDPVSVGHFKAHFQHPEVIGGKSFSLERHYLKSTEPPKP